MKHYDMTGMKNYLERQKQMMKNLRSITRPYNKLIQNQQNMLKNFRFLTSDMHLKSNNFANLLPNFKIPKIYYESALKALLADADVEHFTKIGIFPHPTLLGILKSDKNFTLENITTVNDIWLVSIWPELKHKLTLTKNDCFRDEHLFVTYNDLLEAHDKKLYNLTDTGLAKIVERTMTLAVPGSKTSKVGNKITTFFNPIPLSKIGNRYDLDMLMFLAKNFTAGSKYFSGHKFHPNRHIISHGVKADKLVIFHSINCVLLAHWIIDKTNAINSQKNNR